MITKTILTFLCCVVGAAGAWAQSSINQYNADAAHQRRVQSIINRQAQRQQQANAVMHKTTGGQQLQNAISLSNYSPNAGAYINVDSLVYTWSGNRELAQYPNPLDIFIEPEMEFYANPDAPEVLYPPLLMQADSIIHYKARALPAPDTNVYAIHAYTYNAANRPETKKFLPTMHEDGLEIINDIHEGYSYDANGRITSVIKFADLDTGAATSLAQYKSLYTTYSSTGHIQQDSLVYDLSGVMYVTKYYQDAAGRDTAEVRYYNPQGIPYLDLNTTYTYDNVGRILLSSMDVYTTDGDLYSNMTDSFAYTGTYTYPALHQTTYWNNNFGLAGVLRRINTLNNAGSIDAQLNLGLNLQTYAWDSLTHSRMYYNANNNPDSVLEGVYANNTWYERVNVHYFRYEPTSIKDVTAKPVSIGLYPNPAKGLVHLSISSFKTNTRGTTSIYDMQGRLVQSCGIVRAEQSIDVNRLPVGMYLVQYSGSDGSVGSAKFVKE